MNQQLYNIIYDPHEFISRLTITDKKGKNVLLHPTTEQLRILDALINDDDTLVLKPRQIGSSTIVAAYLFWKVYVSAEPITVAILSHKLKSSKHLFGMIKKFYLNLPKSLRRPLTVTNATEFRFGDSGAGIIAESAGGEGGLRSFTCNALWLSEYAFAPNPEELLATATSALNNGQLIIESTANYFNDAHHQEIMKAERGMADWKFIFFPWYQHAEYRQDLPDGIDFIPTTEEEQLAQQFDLTQEQLYWRKKKIEKIGWEKFQREYPITLEEAYQQLGDSYFKQHDLQHINMLKVDALDEIVIDTAKPGDKYSIGVDVAHGVGRDYSSIFVLSKKTGQPVYMYRSNQIVPVRLAHKIQEVATLYDQAKVLVEDNNVGSVVINELKHLGYNNLWRDVNGDDWRTTTKSKTEMFENLKKKICSGVLRDIDNITMGEIRALTVNEKGNIQIPTNMDSHGDNAVALALACVCWDSIRINADVYLPDWIKKKKADRIIYAHNQYNRY